MTARTSAKISEEMTAVTRAKASTEGDPTKIQWPQSCNLSLILVLPFHILLVLAYLHDWGEGITGLTALNLQG